MWRIFYSWVTGLICGILAKEIIEKSNQFSIYFGVIIALILSVYFVADYYSFFKMIWEEIKSWF